MHFEHIYKIRGTLDTEMHIENTHFKQAECLLDFLFVRKLCYHQQGLSAFLVKFEYQSHISLSPCALLEGFHFIGGTIQDPARV